MTDQMIEIQLEEYEEHVDSRELEMTPPMHRHKVQPKYVIRGHCIQRVKIRQGNQEICTEHPVIVQCEVEISGELLRFVR